MTLAQREAQHCASSVLPALVEKKKNSHPNLPALVLLAADGTGLRAFISYRLG